MGMVKVNEEFIEFGNRQYYFNSLSLINISVGVDKEKNKVYIMDVFDKTKSYESTDTVTVYTSGGQDFMKTVVKNATKKKVNCTFYNRPQMGEIGQVGFALFVLFGIGTIFFALLSLSRFGEILMPPFFVAVLLISFVCYIFGWADYSDKKKNLYNYYLKAERNNKQYHQNQEKRAEEIRMEKYLAENKSPESWNPYIAKPCPHCGHYKVRSATWDDKRMSVAFWGVHSQKIGMRYKCDNCGNMWS